MGDRAQYTVLGATAAVAVALAAVQTILDRSVFSQYVGATNPVAVMVAVAAVAFVSLPYLLRHCGFEIVSKNGMLSGLRFASVVAPLFAAAAITADVLFRYPRDMNVPSPDAFFYYPAIAFVVEVCLHALPLALLVAMFSRGGAPSDRRFWILVLPIATLEAGFQVATAETVATAVFSGIQLLAFGLVQLNVFRRYGFMSMLAFRLIYYSLWHVAWGALRLQWLF